MDSHSLSIRLRSRRGFTLVEIIVMLVILAGLWSLMGPRLSRASSETREASLHNVLQYLRTEIEVYRGQHDGMSPGVASDDPTGSADASRFVSQMTAFTDVHGNVSPVRTPVFRFGPYLPEMPGNPFSYRNGILIVSGSAFPAPDSSKPYGWMYSPSSRQLIANLPGVDPAGIPYTSY
jgi:prepilin-type N-terminal cleavage/methylation domain-containing protein